MKIGLVSAILEDYDFKKMIDTVSEIGYECVEVACWPKAKAERRYAGVSHIDVANLGDKEAEEILSYCKEKNVEISSLAFYPNTMDGNLEKRAANIEHLYRKGPDQKYTGKSGTGKKNLDSDRALRRGKESSYCNRKLPDAL